MPVTNQLILFLRPLEHKTSQSSKKKLLSKAPKKQETPNRKNLRKINIAKNPQIPEIPLNLWQPWSDPRRDSIAIAKRAKPRATSEHEFDSAFNARSTASVLLRIIHTRVHRGRDSQMRIDHRPRLRERQKTERERDSKDSVFLGVSCCARKCHE